MIKRFLQIAIFGILIYGVVFAQIVYVDIPDITCDESNNWTYFYVGDQDLGYGVEFGCWYNPVAGVGFLRFETYGKRVVGDPVNVINVTGQADTMTANLTPLPEGAEIGASSNWQTTAYYPAEPFFYHEEFMDWAGETAYVGAEVNLDGDLDGPVHYMWFRVTVDDNGTSYTLHDYAYNKVAGEPILAGQKPDYGEISGTVTEAGTGTPVQNARIIVGTRDTTSTGADGTYSMQMAVDTYSRIRCLAPGHSTEMQENIVVTKDAATTVDFQLNALASDVVYVDVEDMVCDSVDNTWTEFAINDIDLTENVGFGLWFNDDDSTYRIETYAKDIIGTKNGDEAFFTPLDEGTEIGEESNWVTTGNWPYEPHVTGEDYTVWNGQEKYAGVKIKIGYMTHYGWFRLSVASDGLSFTLLDYAYNRIPGASILAGEKITGIESSGKERPGSFQLKQNYPNPFNPSTQISYYLEKPTKVKLIIYNLLGREVALLENNNQKSAGLHTVEWNAKDLPSGVYVYKIVTENFTDMKKMLYIR